MKRAASFALVVLALGVGVVAVLLLRKSSATGDGITTSPSSTPVRDVATPADVPTARAVLVSDDAASLSANSPASDDPLAITGVVIDALSRPLASVTVTTRREASLRADPALSETMTDASGHFAAAGAIVDGFVTLDFRDGLHLPAKRERVAATADLVVVLADGVPIHGRVIDAASGAPIAGALAKFGGIEDRGVESDTDGRFATVADPSGVFAGVTANGHLDWIGVPFHPDPDVELHVELAPRAGSAVAYFLVSDVDSGDVLENVVADSGPVRSVAGGIVATGTSQFDRDRSVTLSAPGHLAVLIRLADEEARTPRDARAVRLEPGVAVAGRVQDAAGAQVAGASVELSSDDAREPRKHDGWEETWRTVTDSAGRFHFDCMPRDFPWLARVHRPGHADPLPLAVATPLRGALEIPSIVLPEDHWIRGTVASAATGEPIAGALVVASHDDNERSVRTRPDGTFVAPGFPGLAQLTVTAKDFVPQQVLNVPATADVPIDVQLERGLAVSGVVVDANHRPAPGVFVTIVGYWPPSERPNDWPPTDQRHDRPPAVTAADGSFRIGGLVPGRYWLRASIEPDRGSFDVNRPTIELTADVTGLELTLFRRTAIAGTVTDARGGKPITAFAIGLETEGSGFGESVAEGGGRFVQFVEPNVDYTIVATADGYCPVHIDGVRLVEGEVRELAFALTIESAIDGTIVDADGQPLVVEFDFTPNPGPFAATDIHGTDAAGHFHVARLSAGRVTFTARGSFPLANGGELQRALALTPESVELGVGQLLTQKFVARPRGAVDVTLRVSVPDAWKDSKVVMTLRGPGADDWMWLTVPSAAAASEMRVPALEPGEYRIEPGIVTSADGTITIVVPSPPTFTVPAPKTSGTTETLAVDVQLAPTEVKK